MVLLFHSCKISNLGKKEIIFLMDAFTYDKTTKESTEMIRTKARHGLPAGYKPLEGRSQVFSSLSSAPSTGQTRSWHLTRFYFNEVYGVYHVNY